MITDFATGSLCTIAALIAILLFVFAVRDLCRDLRRTGHRRRAQLMSWHAAPRSRPRTLSIIPDIDSPLIRNFPRR